MHDYYIIYKPYRVVSQFTSERGKQTLADFFTVPKDVYPVGRLDEDSEGLLILTNDVSINHRLLNPSFGHIREYLLQVEGSITQQDVVLLQRGAVINLKGTMYQTKPCVVTIFGEAPSVTARNPPVRFRKNIPTSWIKIKLTEGKNRQVRKMCAGIGFPVLRLIRTRIEGIELGNLQPGEIVQLSKKIIYEKLFDTA